MDTKEVADAWEELLPETEEHEERNKFPLEEMDTAVETWKYEEYRSSNGQQGE